MAFLEISGLQKFYGPNHVVRDFNLDVGEGEFVSFLGPSGCGKTTTLRMVAGFETPSEGVIRIDGRDVVNLKPSQRDIGMVFQAYALFPNMTVAQNVAFGLKVAGMPRPRIAARVAEMLAIIKLPELGARFPFQLSGGQQQRVALARALAVQPKVLLLDEPLSALDAKIRVSLREEIRAIQRKLGITTIYVTHDQEEALAMSDRIVVMRDGIAEQIGDPFEIYNRPATRFVASFVGTLNVLDARLLDPATGLVTVDGQEIRLARAVRGEAGETIPISLRPQAILLGSGPDPGGRLRGRVDSVSFLGSVVRIRVALDGQNLAVDIFNTAAMRPPKPGETVDLAFATGDVLVLEGAAD
ncbi:MAG TPA: ABC transporter ATP-binding protein [Amaricoccus sp.]|uniref:ABC transporter ATP-binding protein n=1 Tax=Amaricoccus sp. TaxID=1872485 RepID=UPI002C3AAFA0|nr:ABC transporter ATP-binding protein [Amaricoccus sp.]HMQ92084.1 ABC transporter ATP-binding protein [Amaricoccus sp.]HMR51009.1 ABC transporter ATP-binding protein [Amaricoccus sp.]HMR59314.1 ABC transporter ATP-binding protein [Amaricoccus sp.]HMT97812.1 ABC transporter ATP-binding protein [Amaricoccus sp.]